MRILGLWLLAAAFAAPQTPSPALVRGVLLERDSQASGGEFSVRLANHQVLRYLFDRDTRVDRFQRDIEIAGLRPGENVEVASDPVFDSPLRYARTVHVIDGPPSAQPAYPARPSRYRDYLGGEDRLIPTGNLTFSGVVFHLTPVLLVLHTREGERSLKLRKDTLFLADGARVPAASLRLNTRVFVRAGKDLYDEVEVYQVIWGRILEPK